MTPVDVEILKENIHSVEWMSRYFQRMKSANDEYRSRGLEAPALGGGYTQNYICPTHGKYLRYDPDQPHRHFCKECNKYYEGAVLDACWRSMKHDQNIESARDAGLIYRISGDASYAEWARTVLVHYAKNYGRYPPQGGPAGLGRITSQSLNEAVWLINAATAYDLVADAQCMSDKDRELILKKLFVPAARHIRSFPFGIHNIQVWHSVAMLTAGLLGDSNSLTEEAMNTLCDEIEEGITKDGLWYETSVGYHLYAMKPFSMLAAIYRNRGLELCDSEKFRRYFTVLPEIAMPDLSLPAINDYRHSVRLAEMTAGAVAARYVFNDTSFDPLIRKLGDELNWDALERTAFVYYRVPEAKTEPQLWQLPKNSRHLPDSGITILRRNGLYALIKYNAYSGGHDHNDRLGVIFHSGDRKLFPDLGTVPYGHPLYRSWYRRTEAHNTIMVDGKQQEQTGCAPLGFYDEDDFTAVAVECGEIYSGVSIRRILLLADGALVDVTAANSAAHHTYDWFLHINSGDEMKWKSPGDSHVDALPPNPEIALSERIGFENETSVSFHSTEAGTPAETISFYTIKPSALYLGSATGFSPDEKMPIVMWRQEGTDGVFIAVTQLADHDLPKIDISDQELIFHTSKKKEITINFRDGKITLP
ncbi:MAG: alginate lyase family protein [bacterium]